MMPGEVKWPRFEMIKGRQSFVPGRMNFDYYWRLVTRNGKIIADSGEGYSSKSNCKRAINRLHSLMLPSLPIIDKTNG